MRSIIWFLAMLLVLISLLAAGCVTALAAAHPSNRAALANAGYTTAETALTWHSRVTTGLTAGPAPRPQPILILLTFLLG
jgi:hypothetical protein